MNNHINDLKRWGNAMNLGLAYLAHPYGGKQKNADKAREIEKEIYRLMKQKGHEGTIMSGIHAFCHFPYEKESFKTSIDRCLTLLNKCDSLILSGDWQSSKGCCAEYAFAVSKSMPIFEWRECK